MNDRVAARRISIVGFDDPIEEHFQQPESSPDRVDSQRLPGQRVGIGAALDLERFDMCPGDIGHPGDVRVMDTEPKPESAQYLIEGNNGGRRQGHCLLSQKTLHRGRYEGNSSSQHSPVIIGSSQ